VEEMSKNSQLRKRKEKKASRMRKEMLIEIKSGPLSKTG